MSASPRMKVGVFAAGLCCMIAAYAVAQRQEQPQAPGQPRAGQIDRPATQQQRQQYQAQFRGTQTAGHQQDVERYLASCLSIKNQAEIEANQFGQQQAENPEVKQFAQQMVKDHQQLAQKLQQIPSFQVSAQRSTSGARGQLDAQRQPSGTEREVERETDSQTAPGQNRNENSAFTADQRGGQGGALKELLELDRQITERCQQMVREELQSKSGAEFDKCFVGSQIGNHVHMLAALEVIEQQAQGELRQVAQEARPIVQNHLDHAKQLAKQLEGASQTGARAERQPSRTQR